mmetsp:Transcript_28628/g.97521  ORF Transcript_28628/g.97521 Transcript_28628/m.97521 type:complete len:210 (-) Transcript_28628:174-803(-)
MAAHSRRSTESEETLRFLMLGCQISSTSVRNSKASSSLENDANSFSKMIGGSPSTEKENMTLAGTVHVMKSSSSPSPSLRALALAAARASTSSILVSSQTRNSHVKAFSAESPSTATMFPAASSSKGNSMDVTWSSSPVKMSTRNVIAFGVSTRRRSASGIGVGRTRSASSLRRRNQRKPFRPRGGLTLPRTSSRLGTSRRVIDSHVAE